VDIFSSPYFNPAFYPLPAYLTKQSFIPARLWRYFSTAWN
jgi:hypothetical protein